MEIAVPVVGSLVRAALPKLLQVISEEVGQLKSDAGSIQLELKLIQATIGGSPWIGRDISPLQRVCIAELGRFADEIEDCIDRFHVRKTNSKQFAREIGELKVKSTDIREKLGNYISLATSLPAQGEQAPPVAGDPLVHELQVFLSTYEPNSRHAILNCLLYFCLFPRDHPARRNPLIRRWLSEGLVRGENDAVKNLEALIDRRIINSIQVSNSGKAKRCQPNDGMLECISDQFMSQNFMLSCDDDTAQQAVEYVRRLSLHPANGRLILPESLSRLRTLAVFPTAAFLANYEAASFNLAMFEVLRVLDLKECSHLGEDHLEAICDLLLLKYLSFGGRIARIPRKIARLLWLETLDLRRSQVVTVYAEVLRLPRLKHLLGKFQLSSTDTILGTEKLEKFLRKESNLETVSGFVVTNKKKGFPQLLKHMRRLRKVKAWCDPSANLANLSHLLEAIREFIRNGNDLPGSLSIDFQRCTLPFPDTLKAPGSLASLKLCGSLLKFPELVTRLNSIEEVCLSSTNLAGETILAGLRNVPTLKYLKLTEDNLGPLKIQCGYFPGLERICLVGNQSLHGLTIQAGALPRLVSLHMLCRALHFLPGTAGIEITHMAGLKEIALHSGVQDAIKDGWKAAAVDHPNDLQVSFIPSP